MTKRTIRSSITMLSLQLAGLVVATETLAAWPPQSGRMMLVAVDAAAARRMVPLALAAHALPIGSGPWRRSYVVQGERAAMLAAALPARIIVVAAPAAGCGASEYPG